MSQCLNIHVITTPSGLYCDEVNKMWAEENIFANMEIKLINNPWINI